MKALASEVEQNRHFFNGPLTSIYIGGGTPSQVGGTNLCKLIEMLPRDRKTEITVEINPEDASNALFRELVRGGVNRISFGVQSLSDSHLKQLGRNHSAQQSIDAIFMADGAGIDNITIDLMYEIPHQTVETWQDTLVQLSDLPVAHLSLYNLTIEENTPFHRKRTELLPTIPDCATGAHLLEIAISHLESIGLKRYEISAFGRPSVHNIGYWTYRPCIGFGPSAFSYVDGKRYQNQCNLKKWAENILVGRSPVDFEERLEPERALREKIAVGLRMLGGIQLPELGPSIAGDLQTVEDQGFAKREGGRMSLTPKGLLFYDSVASTIV